jgi:hypothetical protein
VDVPVAWETVGGPCGSDYISNWRCEGFKSEIMLGNSDGMDGLNGEDLGGGFGVEFIYKTR